MRQGDQVIVMLCHACADELNDAIKLQARNGAMAERIVVLEAEIFLVKGEARDAGRMMERAIAQRNAALRPRLWLCAVMGVVTALLMHFLNTW